MGVWRCLSCPRGVRVGMGMDTTVLMMRTGRDTMAAKMGDDRVGAEVEVEAEEEGSGSGLGWRGVDQKRRGEQRCVVGGRRGGMWAEVHPRTPSGGGDSQRDSMHLQKGSHARCTTPWCLRYHIYSEIESSSICGNRPHSSLKIQASNLGTEDVLRAPERRTIPVAGGMT